MNTLTFNNMPPAIAIHLATALLALVIGPAAIWARRGTTTRPKLRRQEQADLRTQAANAHLTLLQSQLEPHMLFNTLANLRVLISTDPQRATHMLDHLNDYLRSTLSASRATEHALSAEFDRLRDYLELMAIRMGPRMAYTLDLPAHLVALPVPPLILQSLVENAIVHGLEPHIAGGKVQISALQQVDYLVLQVADSGVGMDVQQGREGFGIAQVRERIATRYGNLATINFIASRAMNTWTISQMAVKMPFRTLLQSCAYHWLR